MRKAFTLMEVNLAILVMAGGILSICGLYSLGFRENRQSAEDVASTAYAEAVVSPLVMALSATNIKWSVFKQIQPVPDRSGWAAYFDSVGQIQGNPEGKAKAAFDTTMARLAGGAQGSLGVSTAWPSSAAGGLKAGLVILHDDESPVVRIGFRATQTTSALLAAPLFYTEVRFQGLADE